MATRPDIAFAEGFLSRFLTCYTRSHWTAAKSVAIYLNSTSTQGLVFRKNSGKCDLTAFADASFADCDTTRKSTGGYCIYLNDNLIDFKSKRQSLVTLSTAEAEYVELTNCAKTLTWFRGMLREFKLISNNSIKVYEDNQSAIDMVKSTVPFTQRTKHIDIRYHYIRDKYRKKRIKIIFVPSSKLQSLLRLSQVSNSNTSKRNSKWVTLTN